MKLIPKYDGRKSFYGKANVLFEDKKLKLKSYNTIVAEIDKGKPIVHGLYSPTTTRHIKEFLKQQGFGNWKNSKEIIRLYGKK